MNLIQYFKAHPLKICKSKIDYTPTNDVAISPQESSFSFIHQVNPLENSVNSIDVFQKLNTQSDESSKSCSLEPPQMTLIDKLNAIMKSTKIKEKTSIRETKRTRKRKTLEQLNILEEFKDEVITKKQLREISEITGLSRLQIYKWYWDLKNKKAKGKKMQKHFDS